MTWEVFEKELLPRFLLYTKGYGYSIEDIKSSNPKEMNYFMETYKLQSEEDNAKMHLQGHYVLDALLATVGNMFKKGGKLFEYPSKPYEAPKPLTEEELKKKHEMLFACLEAMKSNFEINNGGGKNAEH